MNESRSEDNATRASLLVQLRDWDNQQAWDKFSELYSGLIRRVAARAGLANDQCDDVVQETMIVLAKSIKNFEYSPEKGSFRAWLLQSVRWRIADQFRDRKRDPMNQAHQEFADDRNTSTIERIEDPNPEDLARLLDEEWEAGVVRMALEHTRKRVKAKHYQVFDLYVNKNMSAGEVAKMVGVNIGHVYLIRHRVSAVLKKELVRLREEWQ